MLASFKISQRLVLLGGTPLLFLLLVLLASFWVAQTKDKLFYTLYDEHLVILADIMSAQKIVQQSGLAELRKYRTGWASAENTRNTVLQQLDSAKQHWQAFSAQRPGDAELPEYQELDQAFARVLAMYEEWIAYAGSDALLVRILNESSVNNEVEQKIGHFGNLADAFVQQQITAGAEVRDQSAQFTGWLVKGYLLGALLLVLLMSGLIWAITRSVSQPLNQLRDLLLNVAEHSDLRLQANTQGRDEIADAARALNQMLAHFSQLISGLGSSSQALTEQAEQVLTVSDEVRQGSGRQADQATQLATAVDQMSMAIRQVAANARCAADSAEQAEQCSTQGSTVAANSMSTIEQLEQKTQQASSVITQLQQDSTQISSVLEVIRKISEQTNLLALNAAIEAARAGDAGRGFSVVADEVRTLSANTQQATESIRSMIGQLQQQANAAVIVMQQAAEQARQSVGQSRQTDLMFKQIATAVKQIVQRNAEISSATDEQQQVAAGIADGINVLNDDIRQLSTGAERSAAASGQLTAVAEQLALGCSKFKFI
ncbi:methyl-accepting chemotaxis protein [Arsukibacterium sp.]|uniref:methyl-accepting chemotaxis protein n=1 Tax=Arsukibacterium sp. TaxID=1977258 RepID=UPI002FD8A338